MVTAGSGSCGAGASGRAGQPPSPSGRGRNHAALDGWTSGANGGAAGLHEVTLGPGAGARGQSGVAADRDGRAGERTGGAAAPGEGTSEPGPGGRDRRRASRRPGVPEQGIVERDGRGFADGRQGSGSGRGAAPSRSPRRVTSRDVARKAGVSQNTVSLILKGSSRISPATTERVRVVMAEMGYQPNAVAAALRTRTTRSLLFVAPRESVRHHLTHDLVAGVTDEAAAAGYCVVIQPVSEDGSRAADLYRTQLVSAAVIFPRAIDDGAAEALVAAGCPTIAVLGPCHSLGDRFVAADDQGGAAAAVRHLVERGHHRIAVVVPSGPPWGIAAARLAGAQAAARAMGVPLREVRAADWAVADGYKAAWDLLPRPDRPSAVFAVSDRLAYGVLRAAQEMGLRVPADLAVAGFDNAEWSDYSRPPLTTVEFPVYTMGREAVRRLLNPGQAPEWERAPARLIVRGSS